MNIHGQICGLIVVLVILLFFVKQRKVGLHTEYMFFLILMSTLISIMLDITSVEAIAYKDQLPDIVVYAICKIYLVSLLIVGMCALAYILADVYVEHKYYYKINWYVAITAVISVVILILPIGVVKGEDYVYSYGLSVNATYIFVLLYLLDGIMQIMIHGKHMNTKRRDAAFIWIVFWIVSAFIQAANSHLLLVGFACAIGVMTLFCVLENPQSMIDRQLGCFNAHAFIEYMKQRYERNDSFCVLLLSFIDYKRTGIDEDDINRILKEAEMYLEKFKKAKIYKNVDQELILTFKNKNYMMQCMEEIKERINAPWTRDLPEPVLYKPLMVVMNDSSIAGSAEEAFSLLQSYKNDESAAFNNVYVIDENAVAGLRDREAVKEMIIDAIENDRIIPYFQPIYSIEDKRITSAEALARIIDRDGNIVSPGVFIPVAEECGLINQIGKIIFEKTCRFFNEYSLDKHGIKYVEVNLSVLQCDRDNLCREYISIMNKYGINPANINLEITETGSILTRKILLKNMDELRDKGVSFSLDDFGNGESNLNYIIDMPVDIVKLDMNMTRAYFSSSKAQMVVEATLSMVHAMGLKMVAEGIENEYMLKTFEKLGVDYIQGYYFSKPLSQTEFIEYVDSRK